MRKILLGSIVAFSLTTATAGIWYGLDAHRRLEEIRRENTEFIESIPEAEPQGGAEIPFEASAVKASGYVFPVHQDDYLFPTSPYGLRVSPLLGVEMAHQGVDIAAVWRAQVVAISDGTVIDHYPPPGTPYPRGGYYRGHDIYGGMIRIRHEDGMESLYAHLSWTRVKIGRRVRAGEVIGRIGNTGRATGPHLHLEILANGKSVNPLLYFPEVSP